MGAAGAAPTHHHRGADHRLIERTLEAATPSALVSGTSKFGVGTVTEVDGNKLTIEFDHVGRKRVVDSFVGKA